MNLYEAIFIRKTVRKYKMQALDDSVLEGISNFANNLPMLMEGLKVEYKIIDYLKEPVQMKGSFIIKAPYYMVIYSQKKDGYLLNAGYLMEQISLYMTTKGIGSCYLGMVKLKEDLVEDDSYEYIITLAFGEGESEIYRSVENAKRLPLEDIAIFKEDLRRNIKSLMNAARMSPSSMNNQPWKFVVYNNRIHIFCKKNIFLMGVLSEIKEIDIGICISHLLIAAEELWIDCDLQYFDNISAKTFKKYDYVTSLKINAL